MSYTWSGGSTTAWRKIRAAVLVRDNYECQVRTDQCTRVANVVHHTLGRATTGDDPRFLVASCQSCNQKIGDPTKHTPAPNVSGWWE